MTISRTSLLFILLIALTILMFLADMGVGSVSLTFNEIVAALFDETSDPAIRHIVVTIRLNKAFVALLAGSALAVSGLQMQTLFRNPLAGPYVLGISSGASLGVAIFLLGIPMTGISASEIPLGMVGAALAGSFLILTLVGALAQRIKDIMVILILGMMFSSGVSAIVQILQYLSHEDSLKSFVIWTMGSLGEVTQSQLYILAMATGIGFLFAVVTIKPLNQLLLGEEYARTMGMNISRVRNLIFLSTTLLAGSVTAFCGPIGFIGLAMPHVARLIFQTSDHRILVPATIITGGVIMVFCDLLSKMLVLPVNAITALLGIPIIMTIVLRVKFFAV